MSDQEQHLEALRDIRQMMQRSSRFISLSGLSGIAAGLWGLAGSYAAYQVIEHAGERFQVIMHARRDVADSTQYFQPALDELRLHLFLLAMAVLGLALLSAFYFTWRKTKKDGVPLWNHASWQLAWNVMLPLCAGGLFVLALLQNGVWRFVVPACLVFYGLALINGSKYTLSDIRYLGISEIILGLIATQFLNRGLLFWAVGFGLLHIVYGFIMWWKNERKSSID